MCGESLPLAVDSIILPDVVNVAPAPTPSRGTPPPPDMRVYVVSTDVAFFNYIQFCLQSVWCVNQKLSYDLLAQA
jgi:hypothetical protein